MATVALAVLLGGLAAATLVRFAPGFGVDGREWDPRLSEATKRRIREESQAHNAILPYYVRYLGRVTRGDLGYSSAFGRPAAGLIAERFPETARSAGAGLAAGWALGMLLALSAVAIARPGFDALAGAGAALFLCLPSSAVALAFVIAGNSQGRSAAAGVIALVIFPRVFRYARGILGKVAAAPHVLIARSRGLGRSRVIFHHVLRPAIAPLAALLGVSVSAAFGAAIPVEVICDSAGLGQLAWQAALKRDLPLLIDITLLVTVLAGISGLAAEAVRSRAPEES